jgi:sigma-B regulation protein RsbU (phosphoserine phosphatase)
VFYSTAPAPTPAPAADIAPGCADREGSLRILLAEDDPVSRRVVCTQLARFGHEVITANDGEEALRLIEQPDSPSLVILDWMMPGLDGIELCHRIRARVPQPYVYILLLTAKSSKEDIVTALDAGADDFLSKPAAAEELRARIQAGVRIVALHTALAHRVTELERLLSQVKQLHGLLPICSYCKRVRNDHNYWQQVETYISERTDAMFSHGFCPECYEKHIRPQMEETRRPAITDP